MNCRCRTGLDLDRHGSLPRGGRRAERGADRAGAIRAFDRGLVDGRGVLRVSRRQLDHVHRRFHPPVLDIQQTGFDCGVSSCDFGGRVAANIDAEVAASYTTPELRTTISTDLEAAGSTVAVEPVQQFIIEGAAIIKLTRWRPRPRVLPFVSVGAGYLRQLHDAKTLVETGQTYHVGGGAKLAMMSRMDSRLKIGLRMEARACIRSGGVALDDRAHAAAAITAALFARF